MLLADHQIRELCKGPSQMITPFRESCKEKGIISRGLSSYGYDISLSGSFKIFHDLNNSIVDPKNFDNKLLMEIEVPKNKKDNWIIIPPRSFALGVSEEYFNIPSNVMGIILGKSTYARCFTGDTKISLVNGEEISFTNLVKRYKNGERLWGYGVRNGRIQITEFKYIEKKGKEKLIKVYLDNGEEIKCTYDHKFLLRNGTYKEAQYLSEGESLMPLYRVNTKGYESVYHPEGSPYINSTHHLSYHWGVKNHLYPCKKDKFHIHHKDENKKNNIPTNLSVVPERQHIQYHNDKYFSSKDYDKISRSNKEKEVAKNRLKNPEIMKIHRENASSGVKKFWILNKYKETRKNIIQKRKEYWSKEENRELQRIKLTKAWKDPELRKQKSIDSKNYWEHAGEERRKKQRNILRDINLRKDITLEKIIDALDKTGTKRGAARLLQCDRSVFKRFKNELEKVYNHKVKKIEFLQDEEDVYCLTSIDTNNFALSAGVFVHNCSLIVNCTPMENGWKGYLTIELTNPSPCPLKVYAYEGIAQVLFFQGETQSEITYENKNGKYQHQLKEVTLPVVDGV